MSFFKEYFKPSKATKESVSPPVTIRSAPPTPRSASVLSRPGSVYPEGDFRNSDSENVVLMRANVTAKWLEQTQNEKRWREGNDPRHGVVIKVSRDNYVCAPEGVSSNGEFYEAVKKLNVRCAMTVSTRTIKIFLQHNQNDFVPIKSGLLLQVIPTIADLPRCQKNQFAAFIRDEQVLVVWEDDPQRLVTRVQRFEHDLMSMVWSGEKELEEKELPQMSNLNVSSLTPDELEKALYEKRRPTFLLNPILVGLTLALLICALGLGWRKLAQEVAIDGKYTRLALLAVTPAQVFVSLFFMQIVITNLAQIFGPTRQMKTNSKFYSGLPPPRLDRNVTRLPHVTIQMPVYKEGLKGVIEPTIMSLKQALSTYEMQGGTGNIFVNDDGLQLIPDHEATARREFYDEHNVGWVARPAHNPKPEDGSQPFLRRGKFKKASNMNYALMVSNRIEEKLAALSRTDDWTSQNESDAYNDSLAEVLQELEGRAWAGGNIRVGDYILLIDSDTRVPPDCLLDAASEMELSPEVGILQYSSGVMQVTDSYFESGITFFTDLIYTAIRYTVANGDVAPFVGHNAILRWSALQLVSYEDEDGYEKFWSESHVSEDFDMSLRLQVNGYIIRFGAYTGDGFKEGVSLTVYDELNRWEKYAYGCNELLFHPFRHWITRGPFTPLFRKFMSSNIRFTSKVTIMAYIGTYYAIGAAWVLTVVNYFLMGWFAGYLDKYYLDSFQVYFSLVIVFGAMGNIALALLRYRLSDSSLIGGLWLNFKWLPLLTVFLGGLSLHVSQALLSHFFEVDMSWGATAKEAEDIDFFQEVPRLLKRFKYTFIFCVTMIAMVIVGAIAVPWEWQIRDFVAIYPICTVVVSHFLLPIVLNPALMMFTW